MYFNIVQSMVSETMTRLDRASFWSPYVRPSTVSKNAYNSYFGKILYIYVFIHCPVNGLQNGDEV